MGALERSCQLYEIFKADFVSSKICGIRTVNVFQGPQNYEFDNLTSISAPVLN